MVPENATSYVLWSRKRKLTTITFAIQSILNGCDMAIAFVNLWIYIETLVRPNHQKFYYSFVAISYVLSSAILSTFICKYADKYRNIRTLFFVTNTAYIVGNIIYMLPFSPWLLVVGRLIAGGGLSQSSLMMGELGRCYPHDELTGKISLLGLTYSFGFIVAPAINAAFTSVTCSIGELPITFANISGFYMPALFAGSQIMCFFMVYDLSKEYDLKAQVEGSNTQEHVNNCFADTDVELSSPTVINYSSSNLKLKEVNTNEACEGVFLNDSCTILKEVAFGGASTLPAAVLSSNDTSSEKNVVNETDKQTNNEIENGNSLSVPHENRDNVKATNCLATRQIKSSSEVGNARAEHFPNMDVEMDDCASNNSPPCSIATPIASDDLKLYDSDTGRSTVEQPSNIHDSTNQVETSQLHYYSIPDRNEERCSQTSNDMRKPSLISHNSARTSHSYSDTGVNVMDESDHTSSNHSNIVASEDNQASIRWLLLEMLTHYDTCLLLVVSLFENFLIFTSDLVLPIIVVDILKWPVTALNGILCGEALFCIFPCLVLICGRFTDEQIFYYSVASVFAYTLISLIQIIFVKEKEHFILNVVLSVVYCALFSNVTVLKEVFLGGFLVKMVSSKYQTLGDSIRVLMTRVGSIAAMLSAPFITQRIDVIGSIYITILLVLGVLLIARRKTLKTPTVIIQ